MNELRKQVASLEHTLAKEAIADRMTSMKQSMRSQNSEIMMPSQKSGMMMPSQKSGMMMPSQKSGMMMPS